MWIITANMFVIQTEFLQAAGSKLSVQKPDSFAQEILVTLLQHHVVFFNKYKNYTCIWSRASNVLSLFLIFEQI